MFNTVTQHTSARRISAISRSISGQAHSVINENSALYFTFGPSTGFNSSIASQSRIRTGITLMIFLILIKYAP
jgi:hypothetical protein